MELGEVSEDNIQGSQDLYVDGCCGPQLSLKCSCTKSYDRSPHLDKS